MRRSAPRPDALIGTEVEVLIERLGVRGDGIAATNEGTLYVAGAVPGDRLRARRMSRRGDGYAAAIVKLITPSPARREPECPYFSACGGCAAQHLDQQRYETWKRGLIEDALRRHGLPIEELQPLMRCPVADRRRAQLHARRLRRSMELGFHAPSSREIVDIEECSVMRSAIVRLLNPLRLMLPALLKRGRRMELLLTETADGVDLVMTGEVESRAENIEMLAAFARDAGIPRISWRPHRDALTEPLIQFHEPHIDIAGVRVALPPGAFLQASQAAEQKLATFVAEHIGTATRIADLYAGLGAFTLPLISDGRHVHAVDKDGDSLSALALAAGRANLGGRLTTERRDLNATPLQPDELNRHDAIIFDPPRAGAREQARMLALSNVPRVIAISCEASSFARDAATIVNGGYRLETVLPVDQFVYSSKLEIAALFRR